MEIRMGSVQHHVVFWGFWIVLLTFSACTTFSSKEACVKQPDGYSHCAGVAEWTREPICHGTCK